MTSGTTKATRGQTTGAGNRIDRRGLAKLVATEMAGVSEDLAYEMIGTLTDTITNQLKLGNTVSIVGFGSWKPTERAARSGFNPQTRAPIQIPARNTATFKLGETALAALAGGGGGRGRSGGGTGGGARGGGRAGGAKAGGVGGQGRGGRGKT